MFLTVYSINKIDSQSYLPLLFRVFFSEHTVVILYNEYKYIYTCIIQYKLLCCTFYIFRLVLKYVGAVLTPFLQINGDNFTNN